MLLPGQDVGTGGSRPRERALSCTQNHCTAPLQTHHPTHAVRDMQRRAAGRLTLGTMSSMCRVAPLTWMLRHTLSARDRPKNTGWPGQRHSRESNPTCGGSSSLRQGGRQGVHGCTWFAGKAVCAALFIQAAACLGKQQCRKNKVRRPWPAMADEGTSWEEAWQPCLLTICSACRPAGNTE